MNLKNRLAYLNFEDTVGYPKMMLLLLFRFPNADGPDEKK
jgi:hypothetical protein